MESLRRSEHRCAGLLLDCFAVVENDGAEHFGASLIDGVVQSLAAVRIGAARQSIVFVVDVEKDGVEQPEVTQSCTTSRLRSAMAWQG